MSPPKKAFDYNTLAHTVRRLRAGSHPEREMGKQSDLFALSSQRYSEYYNRLSHKDSDTEEATVKNQEKVELCYKPLYKQQCREIW